MCDSLRQYDQKIKVWKLEVMGCWTIWDNFEDLKNHFDELFNENFSVGDIQDITIECKEMYEHEIENLPEFEGY